MQGNRVHGCYYPLRKRQLEWQISNSDVTKQVEKEQAKFMQARVSLSNQILANVNVISINRCVKSFAHLPSNSHCSLYRKLN